MLTTPLSVADNAITSAVKHFLQRGCRSSYSGFETAQGNIILAIAPPATLLRQRRVNLTGAGYSFSGRTSTCGSSLSNGTATVNSNGWQHT
jgi:hypothetical protein